MFVIVNYFRFRCTFRIQRRMKSTGPSASRTTWPQGDREKLGGSKKIRLGHRHLIYLRSQWVRIIQINLAEMTR